MGPLHLLDMVLQMARVSSKAKFSLLVGYCHLPWALRYGSRVLRPDNHARGSIGAGHSTGKSLVEACQPLDAEKAASAGQTKFAILGVGTRT